VAVVAAVNGSAVVVGGSVDDAATCDGMVVVVVVVVVVVDPGMQVKIGRTMPPRYSQGAGPISASAWMSPQ